MALFQMDLRADRVGRMVDRPFFGHQLAVEPHAKSILSGEAHEIVACDWRNDHSGPAYGIVLQQLRVDAAISPGKIHVRIDTAHHRSAFEIYIPEIVRLQSVLLAGCVGKERVRGNCAHDRTRESDALRVNDLRLREALPDSIDDRHRMRWRSVVVADERI